MEERKKGGQLTRWNWTGGQGGARGGGGPAGLSAGIYKQSIGARNRVGIGLSYQPAIGYTAWRNCFLGIDSWAP